MKKNNLKKAVPIVFGDDESKLLREGKLTQLAMPVKDLNGLRKGSLILVQERWAPDPSWGCRDFAPKDIPWNDNILYPDSVGLKGDWVVWREPATMRPEFSRRILRVDRVKCIALEDITDKDARACLGSTGDGPWADELRNKMATKYPRLCGKIALVRFEVAQKGRVIGNSFEVF